jgi:Cu(I)/Ag(I) efflux system membrane fusion protein
VWRVDIARPALLPLAVVILLVAPSLAQGVRERMRTAPRATAITDAQANELTLTVTQVAVRPIQVWVRTAGVIDASGKTLQAIISKADAAFVKAGQRVRAFPPEARSSMYQARVASVAPRGDRVAVTVALVAPARQGSLRYVLEIVTEEIEKMSIPNEAIIETGDRRVVYVKDASASYAQREIQIGLQGELFTEVTGGLKEGEQVVTFGSFFIDADHKLKGS